MEKRHRNGKGVMIGIIDVHGFDWAHPDFRRRQRRSPLRRDLGPGRRNRNAPPGFNYGVEITASAMKKAANATAAKVGVSPHDLRAPVPDGARLARHPCRQHRGRQQRRLPQGRDRRRTDRRARRRDSTAGPRSTIPPVCSTRSITCWTLARRAGRSRSTSASAPTATRTTAPAVARSLDRCAARQSRAARSASPPATPARSAPTAHGRPRLHHGPHPYQRQDRRRRALTTIIEWMVVGDGDHRRVGERAGDLVRAAGPLRRQHPAARRRLDRPGQAAASSSRTASCPTGRC